MNTDNKSSIEPELTPLYIGSGVEFTGTIRHNGPTNEKAMVLGTVHGDIEWNGILQVPQGGKVIVQKSMRCREMMVNGEITGANEEVVIETGLLRLGERAVIEVATVSVPTGGLEQARGSVINAKLRMTAEHPFAPAPSSIEQPALTSGQRPTLTAVPTLLNSNKGAESTAASLVQIETRSSEQVAA